MDRASLSCQVPFISLFKAEVDEGSLFLSIDCFILFPHSEALSFTCALILHHGDMLFTKALAFAALSLFTSVKCLPLAQTSVGKFILWKDSF